MYFKIIYLLMFSFIISQNEIDTFNRLSVTKAYEKLPEAYKDFIDGQFDESITKLKIMKKNYINLYNMSFLYFYNEKYDKALEMINSSLIEEDDFAWAFFLKAQILYKQGALTESLIAINRAIDEKSIARFYHFKGGILESLSRKNDARKAFETAASENPDRSDFQLDYLKRIYDGKNAEKILGKLKDIEAEYYPQNDFYVFMGDLYLKLNKKDLAIKSYAKYLDYYPKGSFKEMTLSKLSELGVSYEIQKLDGNESEYKIRLGEMLKYKVSYGLNLGEMNIKVSEKPVLINNEEHARVLYELKSTSFLLSLDAIYEAFLNLKTKETTISFLTQVTGEEIEQVKVYIFNKQTNIFTARIVNEKGYFDLVTFELPKNTQDGTAILYYARELVSKQRTETVSTVIDESLKRTDIFLNNIKSEEEALNKEGKYHYLSAQARYSGVAGMTGFAEGWFSVDGEYVPLVGKLRILVGSVRVELVEKK
jgi:tetratricopeptide (TPR) repeat protein